MASAEILFEKLPGNGGDLGLATLNRPEALNALTHNMICELEAQLLDWQADSTVKAVILQGAGDKAFCAGGDIRKIYEAGIKQDFSVIEFFQDEYRLNRLSYHYKKPYISFLNGITMGGGVGISMHASFPVATEQFSFAMPETSIGFFPDVGGSYLLSRCADQIGVYLGLTGMRLSVADAYALDVINTVIDSNSWPTIVEQLQGSDWGDDAHSAVRNVLQQNTIKPSVSELSDYLPLIKRCFCYDDVESILQQLAAENTPWASQTAELIARKSPISLKVTLEQIRRGATLTFDECMAMEEVIVKHFLRTADFYEGVRAALVDKDKSPTWQPEQLHDVTVEQVQAFFTEK